MFVYLVHILRTVLFSRRLIVIEQKKIRWWWQGHDENFKKNPLKVCFLFDADVALCAAFSSLSVLLFQRRPEPCIGFTPLRLSWRCDRPWEARIHSVLILSPSPIGFDWPQHMHSNPYSTANKSLSSDTIQGKVCWRSPAQTLSVFGPDLFWSTPFSVAGCLTWKDRHASGSNRDENCDVVAALMVWITIKPIWMRVSAPFFFAGGISFAHARSHLRGSCSRNYSHYTLAQSLRVMTFHHVTLRGKWHFIFYLQTISGEALWLMHVPPGTCVLLKEPPINLWALPINANRPLIISSLNQPRNICSDKLTEPQNDLMSFYIAAYQDPLWDSAVSLWLFCIAFRLINVSSLLFCICLLWLCVVVILYLFFSILSFFAVGFRLFLVFSLLFFVVISDLFVAIYYVLAII